MYIATFNFHFDCLFVFELKILKITFGGTKKVFTPLYCMKKVLTSPQLGEKILYPPLPVMCIWPHRFILQPPLPDIHMFS